MSKSSLFLWNEQLEIADCRILTLAYKITAAVTVSPHPFQAASLVTFGAISTQATIDNFLGTSSEFTVAQFDATSMGADAMGVIVNMKGQAQDILYMKAVCHSNTGGSDRVERVVAESSLTDSTLETALALGSSGNCAFKINWGNSPDFDALTSGLIEVQIAWVPK